MAKHWLAYCLANGDGTGDKDGETLLHKIAKRGGEKGERSSITRKENIAIVEYLISRGADVNAKDNDGQTPLDLAKKRQEEEIDNLHMVVFLSRFAPP